MPTRPHPGDDDTIAHVRAAIAGADPSVTWVVERFTPLLLAQAHARIGSQLRRVVDPHDLVQEVWSIALPKLHLLAGRDDLGGRTVLAFLARILLYRCNDLVRKHIVGKPRRVGGTGEALSRILGRHTGVVTQAVRAERQLAVRAAIDRLDEDDRRLVVLRGIEQNPVHEIATVLGLSENLVSVRYRRALQQLREWLPGGVFDELHPD